VSIFKKNLRRAAVGSALGAIMSATLVSTPALAVDAVACGDRTDLLKIWFHYAQGDEHRVACYANAGEFPFNNWVDGVSTGNNRVVLHDANGENITLEKWTDYRRSSAMGMTSLTIL